MPQQQHYRLVLQVTLLSWPYCGNGTMSTQVNPTWPATNSQTLAAGSSAAGGTFAVCNGAVKDPEADEGIAVYEATRRAPLSS